MKKDKTKTTGYYLVQVIVILALFFGALYLKWFICDRDKEVDNRQSQEMVDYHYSEGREIQVYE